MPKLNRKLTEPEIRKAPIRDREYKLYDEGGLRLAVRPSGAKIWQYPYKHNGKWNIQTIGRYGEVSTADARRIRDESRKLLREGIAPNEHAKAERAQRQRAASNSFEVLAREWYSKQTWAAKHAKNILARLELDIFNEIGPKPITAITRQEMLAALHKVEERGALDVAKRLNQYCVAIFDYAIVQGLCDSNPALGLAKALRRVTHQHRLYLAEKELPAFFAALADYKGTEVVKLGMMLLFLTMVRPGELRGARWEEFDEAKGEWRIPASRMKIKREHIVPLSPQALAVLRRLRVITGPREHVFPGTGNPRKPISDATLSKCVKIMGYGGKFQPHGARATASTILNERDFDNDVVERLLAHMPKNKVRAAYNHALYLPQRRETLQWWGAFVVSNGMVVP